MDICQQQSNPQCQLQQPSKYNQNSKCSQYWSNMSSKKKIALILTTSFVVLGAIAGFIILGLYLNMKPKAEVTEINKLYFPLTKELVTEKTVSIYEDKIFNNDVNFKVKVTTMEQQSSVRLLQQNNNIYNQFPAVITADMSNLGITILAYSPSDVVVYVNVDQMLTSYFQTIPNQARRLQTQVQLEGIQQDDSMSNALQIDNSINILQDIESVMIESVAKIMNIDSNDLIVDYEETVDEVLNSNGVYQLELEPTANNRLLLEANKVRLLQWKRTFRGATTRIIETEGGRLLGSVLEYSSVITATANASFTSNSQIVVKSDNNLARNLQQNSKLNSNVCQSGRNNYRPIRPKVNSAKKPYAMSQSAFNSSFKCTGYKNKKTCPATNMKCNFLLPTSPITGTVMRRPRYIFSYNPEEAKARRSTQQQTTTVQQTQNEIIAQATSTP